MQRTEQQMEEDVAEEIVTQVARSPSSDPSESIHSSDRTLQAKSLNSSPTMKTTMTTMTATVCLLLLSGIASVADAFGPSIPTTSRNTIPVLSVAKSSVPFAPLRINPNKNLYYFFGERYDSRLFQSSSNSGSGNARQPQTRMEQQEEAYLTLPSVYSSSTNDNNNNNKNKPDVVYIIMYHPGSKEEGVHTTEFPKESGQEVMLAFESLDEINNFANMLREEPTFSLEPVPTPAPLANMEVACQQMGLVMKLVPA